MDRIDSGFNLSDITLTAVDYVQILIIAFLIYHVLLWIKNTRAWNLLKGIIVILVFVLIASLFEMTTILWLAENLFSVGVIAIVIVFQPELRKALENLGGKNFFGRFFTLGRTDTAKFSDKTVDELVKACYAMGRVKTGALIVIEDQILLTEFIRTGIDVDGILTSQLLINIFEHNTPLHDGAVIVRGNRIVAATCYLPLSDNMELSKQLGTRHRAGVGISEVTDSVTIIVSEETGQVSVAQNGRLLRNISSSQLREVLEKAQNKKIVDNNKLRQLLKGRVKHEEKNRK